jgi:uncharacterized protein YyaL (SSP411 family)
MAFEHEERPPSTQVPHSSVPSNPSDNKPFRNRLINSSSPYLLQHAHNPVDWYPWGPEAHERARRENKPIFLSIGYAACHWCHVMEREVFEKPDIAAVMNERFINIKVDREERPDLDDLYMLATQIMSGSGGWPMSVWLTPDLQPFYAGTYFPPIDGYGRPGFPRLCMALGEAWQNRREELLDQARRVVEAIKSHADESTAPAEGTAPRSAPRSAQELARAWLPAAVDQLADRFDEKYGGLGGAPKFPPHQAIELWLELLAGDNGGAGQMSREVDLPLVRTMLTKTLDGMMNGGIYDQVGGGFARYSTDERWLVPHFEKMLYDSAQLAPSYAIASVLLGRPDYARIARETLNFYLREMCSDRGAFFSSLDADSAGAEGLYYVWTNADLHAALDHAEDEALVREHFGLTSQGNWHESPVPGGTVLEVAVPLERLAENRGVPVMELRRKLDQLLLKMRTFREKRIRPGLDDKVLTAWNGLMISALAISGRVLREPRYLEAAHRAIGFLLTHHMEGGRLLMRASRDAAAHTHGYLDDHAYLLNGLMDLIDSTMPTSLPGTMSRKRALELADTLIQDFEDREHGGFFYTSARHEQLFARMKNAADNATPSANGVTIRALLRLARVSGKEQYRAVALRAVQAFAKNIERRPEWFTTILLGLAEDAAAAEFAGGSMAGAGGSGAAGIAGRDRLLGEPGVPLQALAALPSESELLRLTALAVPRVRESETFAIRFHLTIAPGYHLAPPNPADQEAFKMVIRMRGELPVEVEEWIYPPTWNVAGAGRDPLPGYAGTIDLVARCRVPQGAAPGKYHMRVTVLGQPCSETACLPPERSSAEFELPIER